MYDPDCGARVVAQALSGAAKEYSRESTSWIARFRAPERRYARLESPAPNVPRARPKGDTRGSPTARDRGLQWNNPRVMRVYRQPADTCLSDDDIAIFATTRRGHTGGEYQSWPAL